jgi:hypothetical protein
MGSAARTRLRLVTPDRIDGGDALREMAARITDEASWQAILASAQDDETRAELERVVGPLLAFRHPHCHTPLCESGLPPIYQPTLVVRHQAWGDPIYAPIEIRVCEDCKASMRVGDLMTSAIWGQICAKCDEAGEPTPTRILTQLTFDRFDRVS